MKSLILQSTVLNDKWLGKVSTKWKPGISFLYKELNEGKIPLRQLFASTMELSTLSSNNDLMVLFAGRVLVLNC